MPLDQLLLFTTNRHKIGEYERLLVGLVAPEGQGGLVLHNPETRPGSYPEPQESGHTFVQNALIKAAAGVQGSGIATLADDSGLMVDALEGGPGVRSARFAVEAGCCSPDAGDAERTTANNALLLDRLSGVPEENRSARFVCALCLALPERDLPMVDLPGMRGIRIYRSSALLPYSWSAVLALGSTEGRIVDAPRGAGGFGYDPIFFSEDLGKTFGEANAGEKATVSHRGRSVRNLVEFLRAGRLL